jgi:starch phosphorylase
MLEGKELRLRQEYFLSSATVLDILYRFSTNTTRTFELLPDKSGHPAQRHTTPP